MKKIIYVAMAALLLASCTGVAPFSKAKYSHLKWIKRGGEVTETTAQNPKAVSTEKTAVVIDNTMENQPVTEEYTATAQPQTVAPVETRESVTRVQPVTSSSETTEEISVEKRAETNVKKISKPESKKATSPKRSMDDVRMILAIICAFLLPPLGVYLTRETSSPFVIVLVLTLLAFVGVFFIWAWFCWVVAVVLALLAVLQDI